jgi:hypothetical protein
LAGPRPPPEPERKPRGLDTAPAPQIDWAAVINGAIRGERAHMVEAIGQAIGQYGDELLGEVEAMIAAAVNQLRTEFAGQLNELSARIDLSHTQGAELRAQLETIMKRRTKPRLLLPAPVPNGNGHDDASHDQR